MVVPSLRQLALFRTLMETQSVTETAKRMGITQPAVSKMLAQLEDVVGLQLFHRSRGRIHPGPDAERLYVDTERLLEQVEAFNKSVSAMRSGKRGHLAVAAIPILATTVVASAIGRFVASRPSVQVEVSAMGSDEVVQQVLTHRVELGFVHGIANEPAVSGQVIGESEIVCVVHRDHPLAQHTVLTPRDLRHERLTLHDTRTPSTHLVRELFHDHGVTPQIAVETNMSDVARGVVRSGGSIALIDPWATTFGRDFDLVAVAFRPRVPLRISCLQSIYRPRSRLADQFVGDIRAEIAQMSIISPYVVAEAP